jgi:hypothetical protein
MKATSSLPEQYHVTWPAQPPITPAITKDPKRRIGVPKGGGVNGDCNCWIEPDATYTLAMSPNDDLSSGVITIPFQFNLYGDLYTTLFINNNGNISFQNPYGTFSATPFPNNQFIMVAPFWADVDTRGDDGMGLNGGQVLYKVTPTALYVNWVDVGYFSSQTDKKNSFQLIITDGTDPVIGLGKNVSFCYKNMDWTTGAASQGVNGFGGIPAVVGANRGNAVDYIQFGTFDAPGAAYDGPFGAPDGVDWLDNQNFVFTTAVSTQNIPPIASSTFLCDTVRVCTGQLVTIDMNFLAPEQIQTVVASSFAPTLPSYTEVVNTSGNTNVLVQGQFLPTATDHLHRHRGGRVLHHPAAARGDRRQHDLRRPDRHPDRATALRHLHLEQRGHRELGAGGAGHIRLAGDRGVLHLRIQRGERGGDPGAHAGDHGHARQLRR